MKPYLICIALLACLSGLPVALTAGEDKVDEAKIAERDAAFTKSMENCVLVGSFTVDGKDSDEPLKAERRM